RYPPILAFFRRDCSGHSIMLRLRSRYRSLGALKRSGETIVHAPQLLLAVGPAASSGTDASDKSRCITLQSCGRPLLCLDITSLLNTPCFLLLLPLRSRKKEREDKKETVCGAGRQTMWRS